MKTLLTSVLALLVSLSAFAGIPYVISPTNTPTLGMQLFSGGPAGVNYWDWSTNSAGSNSTVVSASASIGVTTNGFNFTPFLTASVTNWVNTQDANGTNQSWLIGANATNQTWLIGLNGTNQSWLIGANGTNQSWLIGANGTNQSWLIGANGTNQSWLIGQNATNRVDYSSNKLWLLLTNYYINPVSGITVTTNVSGQNVVFGLTSTAGGSGTGIQTNGGTGTNNIFSAPILQGASGSTDSNILYIVYGITNWVFRTNGDLVNLGSGSPYGLLSSGAMTNAAGSRVAYLSDAGGTGIQTNNGTGTNNAFTTAKFLSVPGVQLANVTDSQVTIQTNFQMSSVGGAKMQRVYGGTTNGFMSVINARDYGLVSSGGDQTANLQAAITAATNSGLFSVYIPASTNVYTVNGLIIPAGVRLFGDSPKGVIGTGQGSTLYGNAQGKPMLIPSGQNIEIEHIGLLNDGGGDGSVGILITNESSLLQDFSVHDVTIKGFFIGMKMHYTWGGKIANNQIINCGLGIDASNNVNAMHFSHNYFANTNNVWLHGDSNYKNTFDGVNEFEAYPSATFTSSNGVMMAGINQSTTFSDNYFEKITNGIVVNGSYGTIIRDNNFINCPNGTNIIIVGAEGPSVHGNRATDQYPFIHVDSTTYGLSYYGNSVRGGASVTMAPINSYVNDTTNVVLKSSGGWWGLVQSGSMTNASGSRVIYLADLVNGTNDLSGVLKTYTQNATNDLLTTVKTFTNETTLRAYVTNLDNTILTPATATNTMPLYGGFWRLVISTPAAITNLTGVTAGVYTYGTLVLSNSLATTLTNYVQINAIPMGYAATNSVAVLGKNAYVVPAGKQVRLLIDCEGINQTNWAIISQ